MSDHNAEENESMQQLSREEAIRFVAVEAWRYLQVNDRAAFQLQQSHLCMPFRVFHEAVKSALGRPVFTLEFSAPARLRDELFERVPKATFFDIFAMLPERTRAIILE